MPTTNPEKNREYVKASNMKKKEHLMRVKGQEEGQKEYNSYFAENQQKYRDNKKDTEEKAALYKKQQAEYMKQYRAKKKASKNVNGDTDKRANAISKIGDYIKAYIARNDYKIDKMMKDDQESMAKNATIIPSGYSYIATGKDKGKLIKVDEEVSQTKRKGGRPVGSKNKAK
jgi:hypothetical protein